MVQHSDTVTSGKGEWWRCSLPLYIHFFAVLDHIKKQTAADLSLKKRQPYKAIAEKDKAYFLDLYENASFDTHVADLLAVPFGGMTSDDFEAWARKWVAQWKHPTYNVGIRQLIYQPMVELIRYLEFVRCWWKRT